MRWIRLLALPVFAGLLLAVWGVLIEPGLLVVRSMTLADSRWPADYPRLKLAVLGDLHVGAPHVGVDTLREIVERTNAERPDLVLLLGDYVIHGVLGGRYVPPETIAAELGRLRAPLGVVSVLGNHDWWDDGERIRRLLEAAGIRVLENEALRIDLPDRRGLWVAGIADDTTRRPDVAGTLARVTEDAPVLLLSHDPAPFRDVPARPVATFAGHTHGGQISVPFYGALLSPGTSPRHWAYGRIVEDGRTLVVTGGIGTSIIPVRINMPPEILMVEPAPAP